MRGKSRDYSNIPGLGQIRKDPCLHRILVPLASELVFYLKLVSTTGEANCLPAKPTSIYRDVLPVAIVVVEAAD